MYGHSAGDNDGSTRPREEENLTRIVSIEPYASARISLGNGGAVRIGRPTVNEKVAVELKTVGHPRFSDRREVPLAARADLVHTGRSLPECTFSSLRKDRERTRRKIAVMKRKRHRAKIRNDPLPF